MATRGRGEPRECPLDCGRVVRAGHLMCAAHWRLVPKATQTRVWAAWRRWQRTMTDEAWTTYLAARYDALAAVRSQESTP